MGTNNIVTSPQITDIDYFYEIWKQTHSGTRRIFFTFLTTPSADRRSFLCQFDTEILFNGAIASIIFKAK